MSDVLFQTLLHLCVGGMGIAFNYFQMDYCLAKQLLLSAAGRTGKGRIYGPTLFRNTLDEFYQPLMGNLRGPGGAARYLAGYEK